MPREHIAGGVVAQAACVRLWAGVMLDQKEIMDRMVRQGLGFANSFSPHLFLTLSFSFSLFFFFTYPCFIL